MGYPEFPPAGVTNGKFCVFDWLTPEIVPGNPWDYSCERDIFFFNLKKIK